MQLKFRFDGFCQKPHVHLRQHVVAFLEITGLASNNNIGPRGFSATRLGQDMVNGKSGTRISAVLAGIVVSSKYVFLAEGNAFPGGAFDRLENADDRG